MGPHFLLEWQREAIRDQIIGRLSRVSVINGSVYSIRQRDDTELYYMKKCLKEKLEKNWSEEELATQHRRYPLLVKSRRG